MKSIGSASNHAARWGLFITLLILPGLFVGCGSDDSPPPENPPGDNSGGDANDPADNGSDNSGDASSGDSGDNSSDDSGDSGSSNPPQGIGDNNPDLLVAIGDSITSGAKLTGPTYPQRLSSILGKTVKNRGVSGAMSSAAGGQASGALAQKPAYLLIMFGTNDVFREIPPETVANNIAAAVRMAKAQRTIPVVATIPPNLKSESQSQFVGSINSRIRSMASREGAILANVNGEFGSGAGLIQEDGYHPNDTGTQIIAFTFADAVR